MFIIVFLLIFHTKVDLNIALDETTDFEEILLTFFDRMLPHSRIQSGIHVIKHVPGPQNLFDIRKTLIPGEQTQTISIPFVFNIQRVTKRYVNLAKQDPGMARQSS